MATGYEIQMYRDLTRQAKAIERIASALESIAHSLAKEDAEVVNINQFADLHFEEDV